MKRRTLLTGATAGLFSTAGCVGFLRSQLGGDSDGAEKSDEQDDTEDTPNTDHPENANTSREQNTSNAGENETETEYAEAQNPESDTEIEDTSTGERNSTVTEPTEEDVTISNAELTKGNPGTVVTGTLTNESGDTLDTVEIEATFKLEDGSSTSTMWGTNNLGSGESWNFELKAEHVKYDSVVGCDLTPLF